MYVDKTALVYKMITEGKPYFLSRPRRFGKSLLVSTLEAVFQGRRELFEELTLPNGIVQPQLFIANTDWEWAEYPVLRFDFSKDLMDIEQLDNLTDYMLAHYEEQYGITRSKSDLNLRMDTLVRTARRKSGHRVVVLVDEYDKMILHTIGQPEKQQAVRMRFSNLFSPLKDLDACLQFVFFTGITKFSQMGVFSSLNQLKNISMQGNYETICGFTEQELTVALRTDVEQLAARRSTSPEATLQELKHMYDGYHFSERMTDVYNPFSLIYAFDSGELKRYWFDSATPGALLDMLRQMPRMSISDIDGRRCPESAFNMPFDSYQAPLPVLFQSGYLTMKDYQPDRQMYTLGFPNAEVRTGFSECLYQLVAGPMADPMERNALLEAYYNFRDTDELAPFIDASRTFFASVPYQMDTKDEHFYHALHFSLLSAFGADVRAEESSSKGRSDITLLMPKSIYVMELKRDHPADEALRQINDKGYAEKYRLDGRRVLKVGISFSSEEHNITDWKTEEL